MEKEILNVADASDMLSLSEDEVVRLLSEGELPGRRVGPHWYISRQRLLQFIAEVDSTPSLRPVAVKEAPRSTAERMLSPNWRCEKCDLVHPPDIVECTQCGAVRNAPLIGFRLPRPGHGLGTSPGS